MWLNSLMIIVCVSHWIVPQVSPSITVRSSVISFPKCPKAEAILQTLGNILSLSLNICQIKGSQWWQGVTSQCPGVASRISVETSAGRNGSGACLGKAGAQNHNSQTWAKLLWDPSQVPLQSHQTSRWGMSSDPVNLGSFLPSFLNTNRPSDLGEPLDGRRPQNWLKWNGRQSGMKDCSRLDFIQRS